MTRDRRFKHRVRRRMLATGETYSAALAAENATRPPARNERTVHAHKEKIVTKTKPAAVTRMRGLWVGVSDMDRSREFYELLGAIFEDQIGAEGVVHATLGGIRLNLELSPDMPFRAGYTPLFDTTDADGLRDQLKAAGCNITVEPVNEPWGRRMNIQDPDGHELAFIGPVLQDRP